MTLQLARIPRPVGAEFEIADETEATRLIGTGQAEAVGPEKVDEDAGLTDAEKAFKGLNAKDAITFINRVSSLEELSAFARIEDRRPDPRSTVRAVFANRGAVLEAQLDAEAKAAAEKELEAAAKAAAEKPPETQP
jgi:hypothetical protein